MNILMNELEAVKAQSLSITEDALIIDLADGRTISVPLVWYPRLWHGSAQERQNWRWLGEGVGIHWPDLDEDISIAGLLLGKPSGESQRSLGKWLAKRNRQTYQIDIEDTAVI